MRGWRCGFGSGRRRDGKRTIVTRWPFADPPNLAVFTVKQILHGGKPVLYVTHDADDGGWQFLTGGAFDMTDALLVSLKSMIEHDLSLAQLADLPIGWSARRDDTKSRWQRAPKSEAREP